MAIFSSCGQYSKWGSWGIVEFQDQPWDNYPKYRAVQAYLNNLTGFTGGEHPVPQGFTLGQNYPNPFNPSTRIPYFLSEAGTVSLTIFDLAGRKVRQLVARGQSGGMHVAEWDGLKDNGEAVGSGVFFYRLTVDGYSATRKLTLLR